MWEPETLRFDWRRLAGIGLLAGSLLAAAGCSAPSSGGGSASTGGGAPGSPKQGGTLVLGFESDIGPNDIEPSYGAVTNRVRMMMYEGLTNRNYVELQDIPQQVPGLASSWAVAPDGMSYTFKLQPGVKYHDGSPFDATVAKFNFDRDTDPNHPFYDKTKAGAVRSILGAIKDTEAVTPDTFKVNMKGLEVNFLDLIETFYLPSQKWIQEAGAEGYGKKGVGTGPFRWTKYEAGVEAVLEKNKEWWDSQRWGGGPYADKVVIKFIPEHTSRVAALLAGEVDWIAAVPPDSVATIQANPKYYVALDPAAPHTWIWRVNFKNEYGANKKVRQAMALSIDRDRMVKDLLRNTAEPAMQFWSPGNVAYRPVPKDMTYGYDPERAKKLLAEAGYPNGIDITAYVPNSGSGMMIPTPMNEFIQENMAKAGIRVKFQIVEWQTYLARSQAGFPPEYTIFNSSLSGGSPGTMYRYFHSKMMPPNGGDPGWYQNPEVDRLLDEAAATLDAAKREPLYAKVNDLITEDVVFINVVHDKVPLAWSKTVKGFEKVRSWNFSLVKTWLDQ